MRELSTLAKYPFLNETKTFIKQYGPSVDELLHDMVYQRARTIGIERLEHALKKRDVGNRSLATESDCIMEILSYPLARMVTVCVGDVYFKRRYALGEALHVYHNLLNESVPFLIEIAEELGITVQFDKETNALRIYFKNYLRFAPTRYKEWKLVNRDVGQGYIKLNSRGLARIILEALRGRINQELDIRQCNKSVIQVFSSEISQFKNSVTAQKKKFEAVPIGKLSLEKLPPCMKDIIAAIQKGENVPHMGRFAVVAYLHSLKLNIDEILRIFSTAPDYEEDKTRYQVEHITGQSSTTSYKSPSCDKMRTYGICPTEKMDEICNKIQHPLKYYSTRWKQEKKST